ncbi:DM13 domain-containing protein [Denitromonas iodatirespirans]|uniref:DM13 domain-containing protein n=1 Tax=Denitromonas iodatirespirans TaxID=2795389 RepID=A0A944D4W2_DENI1|nr:DM13 domain-containing protein [Denitromonas iodatirespirans]MBT0959984.1 DM13 domain-containing protein [Denitromonas iodatirespirans]
MKRLILLLASHGLALFAGFAAGIYVLPILTAPDAPSAEQARQRVGNAMFTGRFSRDLKDSDALHWGEGTLQVSAHAIALEGRVAPGPDYRLYLSPTFIETEAEFKRLKPTLVHVGHVRTFDNFVVDVPPDIDPAQYTTAIVWCETFGQFITAAKYR